jgi:rRNA processing protein Gar1
MDNFSRRVNYHRKLFGPVVTTYLDILQDIRDHPEMSDHMLTGRQRRRLRKKESRADA